MTTIIERAKAEAERRWPHLKGSSEEAQHNLGRYRIGFRKGATFAARITPEQIEAGAQAWAESGPTEAAWRNVSPVQRDRARRRLVAAARAMGFTVEEVAS